MSLATVAELQNHMQRTLDATQAQQALDLASAVVEAYCNRTFTLTAPAAETFYAGTAYRRNQPIVLPAYPATVTAVTINGAAFAEYRVDEASGLLYRTDGGAWPSEVTVTYGYGSNPIPGEVKVAVLLLATRIMENPDAATSLRLGEYSATYQPVLEQMIPSSIRSPQVT